MAESSQASLSTIHSELQTHAVKKYIVNGNENQRNHFINMIIHPKTIESQETKNKISIIENKETFYTEIPLREHLKEVLGKPSMGYYLSYHFTRGML